MAYANGEFGHGDFGISPSLKLGDLLSGMFDEVVAIGRPLLAYIAFFAVFAIAEGFLVESLPALDGILNVVQFGAYFVGQYLLYRIALRQAGLMESDGRMRVFRFIGMALALVLPIYFATTFFIIPGIILVSKWLMAPCVLIATDRGTFASLGESWNASKGNTLPIALAFSVLVVVFMFAYSAALGLLRAVNADAVLVAPGLLVAHLFPLLMMGLSLAAYRRLNRGTDQLSEVFA